MKESTIINGLSSNANNLATLYKQIVRLDARQMALERTLSSRKSVFLLFLNPRAFWVLVDARFKLLLADHDRQVREAAEAMEAERKKPKLLKVTG